MQATQLLLKQVVTILLLGQKPDPYDPEETGVFEVGTKSILMDGAVSI